jgi:hypothetical protein
MFTRNRILVTVAIVSLLAVLPGAALLHYALPQHDVVRIVSTEVRRVDLDGKPRDQDSRGSSRDVYYIFAEDVETKKPRVYRNEDTGWGFPPYLKFNSADEQAVASAIAAERGVAAITRYGWRIQLFSTFPNAVNVRRWNAEDPITPWFNIVFFAALAALAVYVGVRARRSRPAR